MYRHLRSGPTRVAGWNPFGISLNFSCISSSTRLLGTSTPSGVTPTCYPKLCHRLFSTFNKLMQTCILNWYHQQCNLSLQLVFNQPFGSLEQWEEWKDNSWLRKDFFYPHNEHFHTISFLSFHESKAKSIRNFFFLRKGPKTFNLPNQQRKDLVEATNDLIHIILTTCI